MELTTDDVISLYMAIMSEKGTECTSVVDFAEIIKIMLASEEFTNFMVKIKHLQFTETDFLDHPYTTFINDNTGFWCFEIKEDEKKEILGKYKEEAQYIAKARSKYDHSLEMKKDSKGRVTMAYDDANGIFTLDNYFEPLNFCETRLYTDGILIDRGIRAGEEMLHSVREVRVSNSTFTILVDYRNNIPLGAEVRGFSTTDFDMVYEEAKRLLLKNNMSYLETIKETPKAYSFRLH